MEIVRKKTERTGVSGSILKAIALIMAISFTVTSCDNNALITNRGELLAEVGDKKLYKSDLDHLLRIVGPDDDTSKVIKPAIENWVRDQAFLLEAEKKFEDTPSIDRKVEKYRAALLRHELESRLVIEKLDTAITAVQKRRFHEYNTEQFIAPELHLKARLVKLPEGRGNIWEVRNQIYDLDLSEKEVEEKVDEAQGLWIMNPSKWYSYREFSILTNKEISVENIIPGYEFSYVSENRRFFLKVVEVVEEGEPLPLQRVEDYVRQLILMERRNELTSRIRNDLYQREMRNNNIKIHYQ
ncbi:MAG: hypothetical protein EA411_10500 [Saprospirales bacterium]|nr:MAG: hypothetical protein EA411_10500 [Saprospirales bacterium]